MSDKSAWNKDLYEETKTTVMCSDCSEKLSFILEIIGYERVFKVENCTCNTAESKSRLQTA